MTTWTSKHYTIFAGFLAAVAAQLSGQTDWAILASPAWWAGLLGQLAALLTALYADKPKP